MKLKLLFCFIICLLIFPFKLAAISIEPKVECDKYKIEEGEIIECELFANVRDGKINALSIKYSFDSTYANLSIDNIGSWQGNADGGQIDYYDYKDYDGKVKISKIKYISKKNVLNKITSTTLKFQLIEVSDEYGNANELNLPFSVNFVLNPRITKTTTTKYNITTTTSSNNTTTKKSNKAENTTTKIKSSQTNKTNILNTSSSKNMNHNKNDATKNSIETTKKQTPKNKYILLLLFLIFIILIMFLIKIIKNLKKEKNES